MKYLYSCTNCNKQTTLNCLPYRPRKSLEESCKLCNKGKLQRVYNVTVESPKAGLDGVIYK